MTVTMGVLEDEVAVAKGMQSALALLGVAWRMVRRLVLRGGTDDEPTHVATGASALLAAADPRPALALVGVDSKERLDCIRPPLSDAAWQTMGIDDSHAPIFDARGHLLGAIGVLGDATATQTVEQMLLLPEREASLRTMAAGLAHEINNPLAYVIANVEIGLEGLSTAIGALTALDAARPAAAEVASVIACLRELQGALGEANDGAARVREIVQGIKKFARMEETRTPSVLDLSDVLMAAVKMTADETRHRARTVLLLRPRLFVDADEGQLVQVFVNLLVNAAQATEEGAADRHEIRVETMLDGEGRAVVEISDTGSGIAPDDLARIFDAFFTTKPVGLGLGLGLAISGRIIESFGGAITVASEVGRGTTFRVVLPCAEAPDAGVSQAKPTTTRPRRGKILVIDDEVPIGRAIARILRDEHDVVVVDSGCAAMLAIEAGDFDLIFCDLMMPTMSGMDVYETLLLKEPEQARRMVFLSGGVCSPQARDFLERDGHRCLGKPFTKGELSTVAREQVERALRTRGSKRVSTPASAATQ